MLRKSSILINVVDLKQDTSNFLQKIFAHIIYLFKKSFALSLRSSESLQSPVLLFYMQIQISPAGKYMFVEYLLNIPIRYSLYTWKKIPYGILGIFRYHEMHPVSNQPARFSVTAKTHKFKSREKINVDQLKLCPISNHTSTYIHNTSKVIAKYLKPKMNLQ